VSVFFALDLFIFVINRRSKLVVLEQNTFTLNDRKKTCMVVKSWKLHLGVLDV